MRPNPERAPTFLIFIFFFFLWNNGLVSQVDHNEVVFVSLTRDLQTKVSGPWMDPGLREGTWEHAKSREALGTKLQWLGNPLQYSCLENPRDGGTWWAAVYGVAQSRTRLKWLSSSSSSVFSKFPFPFKVSTPFQTLQDWVNNSAHGLRKNYLEIEPSVLEMQTCK